jgi:putative membrane protein
MLFLWAKTLHIVAVVAWFAGLFYLPRLFVYHAEALAGPEPARGVLHTQFTRMERILERAIMRPALVVAIAAAAAMLVERPGIVVGAWLHAKLALVGGVVFYHGWCQRLAARLADGRAPMSSQGFRLFNELPTMLLVLVVFLVVFQYEATPPAAAALAGGFGLLLVVGVFGAARRRARTAVVPRAAEAPVPVGGAAPVGVPAR